MLFFYTILVFFIDKKKRNLQKYIVEKVLWTFLFRFSGLEKCKSSLEYVYRRIYVHIISGFNQKLLIGLCITEYTIK